MEAFYEPSRRSQRQSRERRHHPRAELDKLIVKNIVKFSRFLGIFDPNVYEEWEKKVEQISFSFELKDLDIIKLVMLEFEGYACGTLFKMR